jgi:hypothetical protein
VTATVYDVPAASPVTTQVAGTHVVALEATTVEPL